MKIIVCKPSDFLTRNLCKQTRDVNNPYETYHSPVLPNWEWRVLKKYQSPRNELANEKAVWFCAVKSPATYDKWEYGDVYISDIIDIAHGYKVNKDTGEPSNKKEKRGNTER